MALKFGLIGTNYENYSNKSLFHTATTYVNIV